MEDITSRNWKTRKEAYLKILNGILAQEQYSIAIVESELVHLISDPNPNPQLVALQVCEAYLDIVQRFDHAGITKVLVEKSFQDRSQNANLAKSIILKCAEKAEDQTVNCLINCLQTKSPKILTALLDIFSTILPSLDQEARGKVVTAINPLTEHAKQSIRADATKAIEIAMSNVPPQPHQRSISSHSKSREIDFRPSARRSFRSRKSSSEREHSPQREKYPERKSSPLRQRSPLRKSISSSSSIIWTQWVPNELVSKMMSSKWQDVMEALEELQSEFELDHSKGSAFVYGIAVTFSGKTFTPKVMLKIIRSMLFYIQEESASITEDAYSAAILYGIEKIADPHIEKELFLIFDMYGSSISYASLLEKMAPVFNGKSKTLPQRGLVYLNHLLNNYAPEMAITKEMLIEIVRPLCSHPDNTVRILAFDSVAILHRLFGEQIISEFHSLIRPIQDEIRKRIESNRTISPTSRYKSQNSSPRNSRMSLEEISAQITFKKPSYDRAMGYLKQMQPLIAQSPTMQPTILRIVERCILSLSAKQLKTLDHELLDSLIPLYNIHQKPSQEHIATLFERVIKCVPSYIEDSIIPNFTALSELGQKNAIESITKADIDITEDILNEIAGLIQNSNSDLVINAGAPLIASICRAEIFDPFIGVRLYNGNITIDRLVDEIKAPMESFFQIQLESVNVDQACATIKRILEDFNRFSLEKDLILEWIVYLAYTTGSASTVVSLLSSILDVLRDHGMRLTKPECALILSVVLEDDNCSRSDFEALIQEIIEFMGNSSELMKVLSEIIDISTTENTLVNAMTQFVRLLQNIDRTPPRVLLERIKRKLEDVFGSSNEAISEHIAKLDEILGISPQEDHYTHSISEGMNQKIQSNKFEVYRLLTDINSPDYAMVSASIKALLKIVRENERVLCPHYEALLIAVIAEMHVCFAKEPFPSNLCKYLSYFMLTLLSESSCGSVVDYPICEQTLRECVMRLAKGNCSETFSQILKAITSVLVLDFTLMSFEAITKLLNETRHEFNDTWIRILLNVFKECINKIVGDGRVKEAITAVLIIEDLIKIDVEGLFNEESDASLVVDEVKGGITRLFKRYKDLEPNIKRSYGSDSIKSVIRLIS